MKNILIIDDEEPSQMLFKSWLGEAYNVITAGSPVEGVPRIFERPPIDCIVIDYFMPGENGFQLLHRLFEIRKHIPPIIFTSGVVDYSIHQNALALGAAAVFEKGKIVPATLIETIERITQARVA